MRERSENRLVFLRTSSCKRLWSISIETLSKASARNLLTSEFSDDRKPVYDRAPADLDPATASDLAPEPNDGLQEAGGALRSEPEPGNSQTPSIDPAAVSEPAGKGEARKRLGRPPLVPKLREKLVRELVNQGKFEGTGYERDYSPCGARRRGSASSTIFTALTDRQNPQSTRLLHAERRPRSKSKKSKKSV